MLLASYGAVSAEVACAMAEGLQKKTGCDVALAVTGIAGPDGGTDEKPIGLVYIAVRYQDKTVHKEVRLNGNRERIRTMTAMHAMNMARCLILDCYDGVDEK